MSLRGAALIAAPWLFAACATTPPPAPPSDDARRAAICLAMFDMTSGSLDPRVVEGGRAANIDFWRERLNATAADEAERNWLLADARGFAQSMILGQAGQPPVGGTMAQDYIGALKSCDEDRVRIAASEGRI